MEKNKKDIVINVTNDYSDYTTRLNWDAECDEMIRQICVILRGMTFMTPTIIDSLRRVADEFENEIKAYNNEKLEE